MEKIWKDVSASEFKECFDILNTYSLIETETYRKFAIALFEVAKRQLGVNNCTLNFVNEMKNNLGVSSSLNNTVTLNLAKMEKQTLFKTVATIYHELTHLRQDKIETKKTLNMAFKPEFPFIRCIGNEKFLPPEILGTSTEFFYFTCKHEKQARDVGNECAMNLFTALNELAQVNQTKAGTARFIERCILQTQRRIDKEKADYSFASAQAKAFLASNPNFIQNAFAKIKQEFISGASMCDKNSVERQQCERRFNYRLGSLVLMGCDDYMKAQTLSFVSSNFVNKAEVFTSFVSVVDSPYSKTTEKDLSLLFKLAEHNNCTKDNLINYLVSWDKDYLNDFAAGKQPNTENNNGFEL